MANCQYWDCDAVIRSNHFLCYDHYDDFQAGLLDKCSRCGKFKSVEYNLCLPCAQGGPARARPDVRIEHEKAWEKNDAKASEWFAYILKVEGPKRFYVGQTRDLEERMMEHQEGKTATTKGRKPRLYYFERHTSRESAERREAELKELADSNERELRRMIIRFQNYVDWVRKASETG